MSEVRRRPGSFAKKIRVFGVPQTPAWKDHSGDECAQFMLVPAFQRLAMQGAGICIVDGSPSIQQVVLVRCPKYKSLTLTSNELIVEGKLTVAEVKDEGFLVGIFEMDTTSVKLAPK